MRAPDAKNAVVQGSASKPKKRKYSYVPRDPAATRRRILEAAIQEIGAKGYSGARVDNIAKEASVNMRMIYHYFEDKEKLYIAVLEEIYTRVRLAEQELHIEEDDPKTGVIRLVSFTFDHFLQHPDLISIVMNENILMGEFLRRSELVPSMTRRLASNVGTLLLRGKVAGVFTRNPDPVQLWLTIFSLCWVHLSNVHTMSWTLQVELADAVWLEKRRRHVVDVVLSFLCSPEPTAAQKRQVDVIIRDDEAARATVASHTRRSQS